MRAIVLVLLGAVAINAEAEADPVLYHHTGVHLFYHMFGKREAEPEADPLVYNGLVHHGYVQVAGVHPVHHVVPAVHPYYHMYGKREAEAEADPLLVRHTGVTHVAGVHPVHASVYNHHVVPAGVYTHYPYYHMFGKREAEAEPYTIGQVYAGLPIANAIATGHPHNVGVITNMVHTVHHPYHGFGFYG